MGIITPQPSGSIASIFHWYPVYGGGQQEFSFKWLESHKNFAELGADYERYGNGRGFETRRELLGHLIAGGQWVTPFISRQA